MKISEKFKDGGEKWKTLNFANIADSLWKKELIFVISAEKVLIQSKVRRQANRKHINRQILMDILRGFGKPNSAIRVISIISAIILALLQFFGMGYSVKIDAGWFSAKTKNMNAVKFLYEALFKSASKYGLGIKLNIYIVIGFLAFAIVFIVLFATEVMLIKYIISDYHVETIIDVDKGMSMCGIVAFAATIIIGFYIKSKLGESLSEFFNINVMCYIGLIYSILLQIFSRLIIKSQLDRE